MRVHLRRRVTKLSGQILAAQRVAAAPGKSFVAAPLKCPALLSSQLLALAPAALATRPTRLLPRAAMVVQMTTTTLQEQFGQIDIYLFDQLLKGRIVPGMRVLDAGCGSGRNIVYLLREGYEVFAADADAQAVESVRALARRFAPGLPPWNFRVEPVERMSFEDACADVVISNTVLHLAGGDEQFEAMLQGTWRVLRPGGLFFCRLASTIGMESQMEWIEGRRYRSPDGADRYMVDAAILESLTERLGGELLDPLKTTVVHNMRSMTTWVMRKK